MVLQVAAELGIVGLAVFFFLVIRAFLAPLQTRRLLRAAAPGRRAVATAPPPVEPLGRRRIRDAQPLYARAVTAALAGWFVCALFASVAYHWTFYYLLALAVAPRDYLLARAAAAASERRAAAGANRRRRRGARMSAVVSTLLRGVRQLDKRLSRRSDRRRILVDARTPVNFTMVAPVFRAMQADPRVEFYFTATEEPARLARDLPRGARASG